MVSRIAPQTFEIYEGSSLTLVARVETAGGTPIVIADVTSFNVDVFQLTANTTPRDSVYSLGAITPATGFFDTLQHGDAENMLGDSIGYNFKYVIAADDFLFHGGNHYRVEIAVLLGNSNHVMVFEGKIGEVYR